MAGLESSQSRGINPSLPNEATFFDASNYHHRQIALMIGSVFAEYECVLSRKRKIWLWFPLNSSSLVHFEASSIEPEAPPPPVRYHAQAFNDVRSKSARFDGLCDITCTGLTWFSTLMQVCVDRSDCGPVFIRSSSRGRGAPDRRKRSGY